MTAGCPQCEAATGAREPAGGLLLDLPDFLVHAPLGGSAIAGWLVVAPRRHVEALTDLAASEQAQLFALAGRLDRLLRDALGAQKVYLAIFAEVVHHTHLHVIPRFADTPVALRGPRCLLAGPEHHIGAAEITATLDRLRRHLEADLEAHRGEAYRGV